MLKKQCTNVIVVNKPLNWTSNDVVQFIKRKYNYKKVGHAGTLDPNASGVLVLGINEGTKLLESLIKDDKQYLAVIKLGIETDSYDITGKIVKEEPFNHLSKELIIEKINSFIGTHPQIPPIFSAVKIKGKKLYEYARKNETDVKIPEKIVSLNKCEIKSIDLDNGLIELLMDVSKGYYIRSFAHDLGVSLGICATLQSLVRTRSGQFKLENAIEIEK